MIAVSSPVDARELARTWRSVLGRLELEVGPHTFATWLRDTRPLAFDGATLLAEAPRPLMCDWLNDRLGFVVRRAASAILAKEVEVRFVPPGAAAASGATPADPGPKLVGAVNCAFTFERYVESAGNRLALACCRELLTDERPISPLVLWGSNGVGKSHLLHALGCAARARGWAVACLSGEEFATRYLTALRRQEVDAFQEELRGVRLFLLDDLQDLRGKRATLEELVRTIDAVELGGGRVAFASEQHPSDLSLPPRLASRLNAGVVVQVLPPAPSDQRAIVLQLAAELRAALPAWCIDRIAAARVLSVRELKGAVHAAVALDRAGMLDPGRLDAELARIVVKASGVSDAEAVLERVAEAFAVRLEELRGRSRRAPLADARAVAAALLRRRGMGYTAIGRALGGRDAATVKEAAARGDRILEERHDLGLALAS